MQKREKTNSQFSIIKIFLAWRALLLAVLFLAIGIIPLQANFLGGGLGNYLRTPYLWAWANFDGEHYLSIAKYGYQPLTYFFFPIYPILIRFFEQFFTGDVSYLLSGLVTSHGALLIGLFGIYKLIKLDHKENIAQLTILLLLFFPTSFYFASVYTESVFLMFAVWAFYFARTGRYLLAGGLGGLAVATRITGIALFPSLAIEYFFVNKKNIESGRHLRFSTSKVISLLIIPLGLLVYMYYLKVATGDPLAFFHSLSEVFGEQRSSYLVSLPQVFYRYIFKILPSVNYSYFPAVFFTYLELIVGIIFLILTVMSFWKLRLSYAMYLLFTYLIPTSSGSFSSLPRYIIICFPAFILAATYILKTNTFSRFVLFSVLTILQAITCAMFIRGYWIS